MNMNVSLTDELANFVKGKVESGRYTSSSEVIREALRLSEKRDETERQKTLWLREAWANGVASGDSADLELDAIKRRGRERIKQVKA
jgi:antitoxin ParD1/3/4